MSIFDTINVLYLYNLGIFLTINWKMNFNYSVHVSFKNYVISKGDPSPPLPYVTYLSSGCGTSLPHILMT